MEAEKPTLLKLRRQHNAKHNTSITSKQIADAAGVRLSDEFLLELGRPVDALIANAVVSAYSALSGKSLSFADIDISLKDPRQSEARR